MTVTFPRELTAGDSVAFDVSLADYPAPDWQLFVTLYNATNVVTLESEANGTAHAISIESGSSEPLVAGRYDWTAYVTGPDDARITLDTGSTIVRANPATMTATDGRSHARQMLEAIEAALQGKATGQQLDILRARHGDRDLQSDVAKLVELRDIYRREVRAEEQAEALRKGEHIGNTLKVRFR